MTEHKSIGWLEGLTHPIVLAPMAGATDGAMAAAFTLAGGLGTMAFAYGATPEIVGRETAVARAAGPFGVGLMNWQVGQQEGVLEAVVEAGPALLSLSFGDPGEVVPRVRELDPGLAIATQVGTVEEAERALEIGVDVLVARGSEGGGHGRGAVSTLPLLQQVLDLAADVPVLAAGGIATGRGVAAALAAGAVGVWVGTAFAACLESPALPAVKAAMIAADSSQTIFTRAFDVAQRLDWPEQFGGRALTNDFTQKWADRLPELAAQVSASDDLTLRMRLARSEGDLSLAPVYAGQSVGLIHSERSVADVVAELATYRDHLRAALDRLG